MFIAAKFTLAKLWNGLRCQSIDEETKKLWYMYTMDFYSAINKEIEAFAGKWMEIQNIMVNEISQSQKNQESNVFSHMVKPEQNKGKKEG